MVAGSGGILQESGGEGALGRSFLHRFAVIGKRNAAATGLLQIVELHRSAIRVQKDRLSGALRGNADAAQAEQAVAFAGAQAGGIPGFTCAAAHVEAAVSLKRISR